MLYYEETPGDWKNWDGSQLLNGVQWSTQIESWWTPEQLEEAGLFTPVSPDPIPQGKMATNTVVQRVDGVVKFVHILVDMPMPALTMRQMRLGLKNIGGLSKDFILDVINAEIPAGTNRDDAVIWYEETSIVEWTHPMTQALMLLSGIPEQQAVAMWWAASKIPA